MEQRAAATKVPKSTRLSHKSFTSLLRDRRPPQTRSKRLLSRVEGNRSPRNGPSILSWRLTRQPPTNRALLVWGIALLSPPSEGRPLVLSLASLGRFGISTCSPRTTDVSAPTRRSLCGQLPRLSDHSHPER